jgi:hypothetical protein
MARKKEPKYKKIDLISKIVEMSTSGLSQPDILDWLSKEGEVQMSYSYELLRQAKPIILDTLKDLAKDRLEETIVKMERMYQDAINIKDKKLALDIQKEINKIAGLHNHKQEVDVTTGGEKITMIRLVEKNNNEDDKSKD